MPWEYDNYVFLASVHNIAGQTLNPKYYDDAVAVGLQRHRGREVRPGDPHRARSRRTTAKGDNAKAIEQAKIAADMDPNYIDACLFLSSLYETSGDKANALAVLKKFDARSPGNTSIASAIQALESSVPVAP